MNLDQLNEVGAQAGKIAAGRTGVREITFHAGRGGLDGENRYYADGIVTDGGMDLGSYTFTEQDVLNLLKMTESQAQQRLIESLTTLVKRLTGR